MDLYLYSDESGVFDKAHNEIFVYGGLIFVRKDEKDNFSRRYKAAEKIIRGEKYSADEELKASRLTNKEKGKLYRSLNGSVRLGIVINQKNVLERIFMSKKDKGTYNMNYDKFFPPVFEDKKELQLMYCDSKSVMLIRAADTVTNRIYYMALNRLHCSAK